MSGSATLVPQLNKKQIDVSCCLARLKKGCCGAVEGFEKYVVLFFSPLLLLLLLILHSYLLSGISKTLRQNFAQTSVLFKGQNPVAQLPRDQCS
jgi:hypothetical protein